ncbi:hypothetical protein D3C73_874940 [compost metagenome]
MASCSLSSGGMLPSLCPDWDEMTIPEPPSPMILPNSSSKTAVPYRSTLRMVSTEAWEGETPAALIRFMTVPWPWACCTSLMIDSRDDKSTTSTLVSKPASSRVLAAVSAFIWLMSASTTCLPAPTRLAMACPMDPAPTSTTTSFLAMILPLSFIPLGGVRFTLIYKASVPGLGLYPPPPGASSDAAPTCTRSCCY